MAYMLLGRYQHYKGDYYDVLMVARHHEDAEEWVVYKALYEHPVFGANAVWVRLKKEFLETVAVDGEMVPRFRQVAI